MKYPDRPGARARAARTSHLAADLVTPSAPKMLQRVEAYIRENGPCSPEEIVAAIVLPGERLLLNSVRARVCQLRAQGRVIDSGERGVGESLRAKVVKWRLSTPAEREAYLAKKAAAAEDRSARPEVRDHG